MGMVGAGLVAAERESASVEEWRSMPRDPGGCANCRTALPTCGPPNEFIRAYTSLVGLRATGITGP